MNWWPALGRVNSSLANFFTETSVTSMSFQINVSPIAATMGVCVGSIVGVGVLPAVGDVATLVVVAVVPQAMSPANRMSARRMAIDLRCDMIVFFLPACLHCDVQDIAFFIFKGAAIKAAFLHLVMLYEQIEVSMVKIGAPAIRIDNVECLS